MPELRYCCLLPLALPRVGTLCGWICAICDASCLLACDLHTSSRRVGRVEYILLRCLFPSHNTGDCLNRTGGNIPYAGPPCRCHELCISASPCHSLVSFTFLRVYSFFPRLVNSFFSICLLASPGTKQKIKNNQVQ